MDSGKRKAYSGKRKADNTVLCCPLSTFHCPLSSASRAFTLIELIVALVILSVLAAAIAPRLGDDGARRAARAAIGVRNLLSVAAHRDSLGGERLAVAHDPEGRTVSLEAFRSASNGERVWRADPLTPAAGLGPLTMVSAALDGRVLDAGAWRIELPEHEPRPVIELTLERPGTKERWTIVLLPGATEAEIADAATLPMLARPVDLDAQGTGSSAW